MAGTTPAKRTPRKATPAKASAPAKRTPAKASPEQENVTPLKAVPSTTPRVVLDLDTLTKQVAFPDLKLPKVAFTFLLDGVQYELGDPRDSDWKMALQLASNPFLLMRTALVGADDPIDDPTTDEIGACRERHGLLQQPPAEGTPEAKQEAETYPDGVTPAVIDRFTAAHLPGWKLNALFENWHEHYRIDLRNGRGILEALLGKNE